MLKKKKTFVRVSGIVTQRESRVREKIKMKTIVSAVCCVVLGCVLVCAQGSAPAMTDQQFVDFAAQTDMLEAHLGQLAAAQASSQGVKDYTQLGVVAGKDNLVVPKGLDAAHDKMIAPFQKLKGPAFDHRYIREMIAGHTAAIKVYTKEAADAQSADLKAYANETLPTLQKHLDGAKNLAKAKPSSKSM